MKPLMVFLDGETFYDKKTGYTLKEMSIEEYVRDHRFEMHLLGIAINDGPVQMYEAQDVPRVLSQLPLEDPNTYTFIQNGKFDGFLLYERFNKFIFNPICTRAMARFTGISRLVRESQASMCEFLGTGAKGTFIESMSGKHLHDLDEQGLRLYKSYCESDVRDLRANVKKMLPRMTMESLEFIGMTTKMYTWPRFILDQDLLTIYYAKLQQQHADARLKIQHLFKFPTEAKFKSAIRSAAKITEMFESLGVEVPMKVSLKSTATNKKKLEAELETYLLREAQGTLTDYGRARLDRIKFELDNKLYVAYTPALSKKDPEFIKLLNHPKQEVADLASVRVDVNSSQAMSRTVAFTKIAKRGRLPVPLEAFLAWTGRYTAGETEDAKTDGINLQNLSKRGGDKSLRLSLGVQEDEVVVAGDSSQIEARVGAYLAGQWDLVNDFATGADPYSRLGGGIYNADYATILYWTKGEGNRKRLNEELIKLYELYRFVGKTGILQLQFASGYVKLAWFLAGMGVTLEYPDGNPYEFLGEKRLKELPKSTPEEIAHFAMCLKIVNTYRSQYYLIPQYWKECDKILNALLSGGSGTFGGPKGDIFKFDAEFDVFGRKHPAIILPDGYPLIYPGLVKKYNKETKHDEIEYTQIDKGRYIPTKLYGGKLFANLVQGLAMAIMRWQAIRINRVFPIALNVHDEWTSIVNKIYLQQALDVYNTWQKVPPPWIQGLPLACEVHHGRTYGEV